MVLTHCNVLLADDHPLIHAGVEWAFSNAEDLCLVGKCFSYTEVMQAAEELNPDVVIVDLRLPDGDGLDVVRRLSSRRPPIATLVFSGLDEDLYAERVLRAGAKGYLQKDVNVEVLLDAVRMIAEGKIYLSDSMHQRFVSLVGNGVSTQNPLDSLSDRELQVFQLIGQGKSTRQIADHLRRSVKTIETYRDRLRKKLGLESGTELTHIAIEHATRSS